MHARVLVVMDRPESEPSPATAIAVDSPGNCVMAMKFDC